MTAAAPEALVDAGAEDARRSDAAEPSVFSESATIGCVAVVEFRP
jgi:hypothetical protein